MPHSCQCGSKTMPAHARRGIARKALPRPAFARRGWAADESYAFEARMTLEAGAPGALPEGNSRPPVRANRPGRQATNARPFATGTPQDTAALRGHGRSTAFSQVKSGTDPCGTATLTQMGHSCSCQRHVRAPFPATSPARPPRFAAMGADPNPTLASVASLAPNCRAPWQLVEQAPLDGRAAIDATVRARPRIHGP